MRNDNDKDNVISLDEFTPLYLKVHPGTRFGWATLKQWREMYRLYDQNSDQKVTWDEAWRMFKFREFSANKPSSAFPGNNNQNPFVQIDFDNGNVSAQQMGPNQLKCYTAFNSEDKDKDQMISFREFKPFYKVLNP